MKDQEMKNEYTVQVEGALGTYYFKEGDDMELAKRMVFLAETKFRMKRRSEALQRYAYIEGVMDYVRAQKKTFWVTATVGEEGKVGAITVGAEVTVDKGRFNPTEFIKHYIDAGLTCNILSVVEMTGEENAMKEAMGGNDMEALKRLADSLSDREGGTGR